MAGVSPKLCLFVSCVGRRLLMGQRTEEEVEAVQNVLGRGSPPIAGFYSYGEIAPQKCVGRLRPAQPDRDIDADRRGRVMAGHPHLPGRSPKRPAWMARSISTRWMHLVAAAYAEKDLDRTRADRASQLVSEELEDALAALETQNLRFKAVMDHMSQGLCLFDRKGRVAIANRRFAEIYQLQASACAPDSTLKDILLRSPVFANCETLDRRLLIEEHEELNSTAGDSIDQVWPDGRTISIVRRAVDDGGFLDTVSDITESRLASARIAHLARHDALTDLPNRAAARAASGRRALRPSGRAARCCALIWTASRVSTTRLGIPSATLSWWR